MVQGMPLFWPVLLALLFLAGVLAIPVGRLLAADRPAPLRALLLLASLALITAATLSPVRTRLSAILIETAPPGLACALETGAWPGWSDLLGLTEVGLNVWLFVPLGLACGVLPRWSQVAGCAIGFVLLPFAVEAAQSALPSLGRVCSGADITANVMGLVAGVVGAVVFLRPVLLAGGSPAARRSPMASGTHMAREFQVAGGSVVVRGNPVPDSREPRPMDQAGL